MLVLEMFQPRYRIISADQSPLPLQWHQNPNPVPVDIKDMCSCLKEAHGHNYKELRLSRYVWRIFFVVLFCSG